MSNTAVLPSSDAQSAHAGPVRPRLVQSSHRPTRSPAQPFNTNQLPEIGRLIAVDLPAVEFASTQSSSISSHSEAGTSYHMCLFIGTSTSTVSSRVNVGPFSSDSTTTALQQDVLLLPLHSFSNGINWRGKEVVVHPGDGSNRVVKTRDILFPLDGALPIPDFHFEGGYPANGLSLPFRIELTDHYIPPKSCWVKVVPIAVPLATTFRPIRPIASLTPDCLDSVASYVPNLLNSAPLPPPSQPPPNDHPSRSGTFSSKSRSSSGSNSQSRRLSMRGGGPEVARNCPPGSGERGKGRPKPGGRQDGSERLPDGLKAPVRDLMRARPRDSGVHGLDGASDHHSQNKMARHRVNRWRKTLPVSIPPPEIDVEVSGALETNSDTFV